MIVTATLSTGISRVTNGLSESVSLIEDVLNIEHVDWETILLVGDHEFYTTPEGPVPNSQFRVSVRPSLGIAALNHTDHDRADLPNVNSYNPIHLGRPAELIFSGTTGMVFPPGSAITIESAYVALIEWLQTFQRPACVQWRPSSPNYPRWPTRDS
ncbi:Imm1 family immunity protein [Actinokineospora diospyrosa]|uniref:Sulfatase-like protein n=1 Tax=Actinokineospora diospyrosa TaxID=103728 RepID=A0ABT1IFH4_9PSEU|nr:Imm1 family immunity protein [Actinokineospora diospyrosa]MCP2271403.1 hypothetical protein [Actinokineospora diospyrosa]